MNLCQMLNDNLSMNEGSIVKQWWNGLLFLFIFVSLFHIIFFILYVLFVFVTCFSEVEKEFAWRYMFHVFKIYHLQGAIWDG